MFDSAFAMYRYFFTLYVRELQTSAMVNVLISEVRFVRALKFKISKLKQMKAGLKKRTKALGLSRIEVTRIAVECGLELFMARQIAAEFVTKPRVCSEKQVVSHSKAG